MEMFTQLGLNIPKIWASNSLWLESKIEKTEIRLGIYIYVYVSVTYVNRVLIPLSRKIGEELEAHILGTCWPNWVNVSQNMSLQLPPIVWGQMETHSFWAELVGL